MRQEDGVDIGGAIRKVGVVERLERLGALEQAAVDEDPRRAGVEQELAAGDGAGAARIWTTRYLPLPQMSDRPLERLRA